MNQTISGSLLAHHESVETEAHVLRQMAAKGRITKEQADASVEELRKGPVAAGDLANVTPQDIEDKAYARLWDMSDPDELTLLKLLPTVNAFQVRHDFALLTDYAPRGFTGAFRENSTPVVSSPTYGQDATYIKLIGINPQVGPLAAMTRTVNVLGSNNAVDQNERAAMLKLYHLQNWNMVYSDTRTYSGGETTGMGLKGVVQWIDEDGGDDNVQDCLGSAMSFSRARSGSMTTWENYVQFNTLLMGGRTRSGFEALLDSSIRINKERGDVGLITWGNRIVGMNVNGVDINFLTDRILSSRFGKPQYTTSRPEIYPSGVPGVTCTAQTDNSTGDTVTSKFDSNPRGAGQVFYVVTYVDRSGVESLGTRYPSGSSFTTVAVDEEVKIDVTHPTDAQQLVIYRGYPSTTAGDGGGTAATAAWEIFRAAPDSSGATTIYDNNEWRPNTEIAIGLGIQSRAREVIVSGADGYMQARSDISAFMEDPGGPRNTVARVNLGPQMNRVDLPKFLMQASNTAMYSAMAVEHRHPTAAMLFKNIIPG